MAKGDARAQEHNPECKRRRRSPRRRRTGNSRIMVIHRNARGDAIGHKVIFTGNDTLANRIWATMLDGSGVLSMARGT